MIDSHREIVRKKKKGTEKKNLECQIWKVCNISLEEEGLTKDRESKRETELEKERERKREKKRERENEEAREGEWEKERR